MTDLIQPGVYFRQGAAAPPAYRLLLLDVVPGATRREVAAAMASIWEMLQAVRAGRLRELEGQPETHRQDAEEQFRELKVLLAYGRRLFDSTHHDPPLTDFERPPNLAYLDRHTPFPSVSWAASRRPGEADLALQFTAPAMAAVNCGAIEVWKAIADQALPFQPVVTYDGFARLDRRGWLEFHDGVSNMDSTLRAAALTAGQPDWMSGGTYMAFLRIQLDLARWRSLGRRNQEIAVGRDKLTGAALERIDEDDNGQLVPVPRSFDEENPDAVADWRDPAQRGDRHLERTHIHRANQTRASPGAPGAFRMFRQGYEFLDELGPDGPRLGLNFVSFQRDLRVLQHVMNGPGWLGDANFGGDAPGSLLTLAAGGLYAVPPEDRLFPGEILFRED